MEFEGQMYFCCHISKLLICSVFIIAMRQFPFRYHAYEAGPNSICNMYTATVTMQRQSVRELDNFIRLHQPAQVTVSTRRARSFHYRARVYPRQKSILPKDVLPLALILPCPQPYHLQRRYKPRSVSVSYCNARI